MGQENRGLLSSGSTRKDSLSSSQRVLIPRNGSLPTVSPSLRLRAKTKAYTCQQNLVFINFNLVNFCSAMCVSLQAPFYPAEAQRKGATQSQYGFVFGVFELVVFIMSPIYGKYMRPIGPKFMMTAGIFITSTCCMLFGFLDKMPSGTPFLAFSFIIRIVTAMGEAGFITASNTIIIREFSDTMGTSFAFMKTSFGLGLIVGPTLGGVLYEAGGFTLPFIVIGLVLFISGLITVLLLPKQDDLEDSSSSGHESFLRALKVPAVVIAGFAVTSTSISIGFTTAFLEPHIRQFNLTPTLTGVMFIVNGGVYAFTSPIWGWLCDKGANPKLMCGIAAVCMCLAFLLIGPAPFFPMKTILWIVVVGLVFQGIGIGGELVCAYLDALHDIINSGFSDNLDTYAVVNGIWNSLFALGAFLGPSIGGILNDNIGFRNTSAVILLLHVFVVLLFIIFYCLIKSKCSPPSQANISQSTFDFEETVH